MTKPTVWTHPANHRHLDGLRDCYAVDVRYIETIPRRKTRTEWHPPPAERFVEYGPEDEAWMRPLGVGARVVDLGPLFLFIDMDAYSRMFWKVRTPPLLFAAY